MVLMKKFKEETYKYLPELAKYFNRWKEIGHMDDEDPDYIEVEEFDELLIDAREEFKEILQKKLRNHPLYSVPNLDFSFNESYLSEAIYFNVQFGEEKDFNSTSFRIANHMDYNFSGAFPIGAGAFTYKEAFKRFDALLNILYTNIIHLSIEEIINLEKETIFSLLEKELNDNLTFYYQENNMRKMLPEAHKLVKITVLSDGANRWTLQWTGGGHFVFKGSLEQFSFFLRKLHVKDDKKQPKSYRSLKYLDIAKEVTSGSNSTIWIWEKDLKKLK